MKTPILFILLSGMASFGCAHRPRQDIKHRNGMLGYVEDGTQLFRNAQGDIIQQLVWRHGRIEVAWERDAGEWKQTVKNGKGQILWYDQDGLECGWAAVEGGEMTHGGL